MGLSAHRVPADIGSVPRTGSSWASLRGGLTSLTLRPMAAEECTTHARTLTHNDSGWLWQGVG